MEAPPKPRGRPKALDRGRVLDIATMQYWSHGPADVSVNDICAAAQVSKPGLYREFGSDDGLKAAALEAYQRLAIAPFLALLRVDQPVTRTVEEIVDFLTQGKDALGLPAGCLFVSMRAQRSRLGPKSSERLDDVRSEFLASVRSWLDALRSTGQITKKTPTQPAAHHFDALHAGAMRMQLEKVPQQEIKEFLRFGLGELLGVPTDRLIVVPPN